MLYLKFWSKKRGINKEMIIGNIIETIRLAVAITSVGFLAQALIASQMTGGTESTDTI
jgi:hypothetical protein